MKIWQKYLLKEIAKFILFFLIGIFILFSIIDFFTHSTRLFTYGNIHIHSIFFYYLHQFILQLYIFLPLAFLFSLIKVLVDMNMHNEIAPLQMAGLSRNTLFKPFIYTALFLSLLSYANFEFFTPRAVGYIEHFKDSHLKKKSVKDSHIHWSILQDNTKVIYQTALDKSQFFDVFWVESPTSFWHAKYMDLSFESPKGQMVDHFTSTDSNQFEKKESFDAYVFKDLHITANDLDRKSIESFSLIELFQSIFDKALSQKDKNKAKTQLNYKLSMPLLPFLMVFLCGPFCMRFSKNFSIFFLITLSLLAFFAFYTLMDSIIILCENQVFSSTLSIWSIFLFLFIFSKKLLPFISGQR